MDTLKRLSQEEKERCFPLPKSDLPRRVESHLYAIRKKGRNKYRKGSGTDLKIVTMINGIKEGDVKNWQGVGVVQTAINPDDKTKPQVRDTGSACCAALL